MNHKKTYDALILKAKKRNSLKYHKEHQDYIYLETHHIKPKCIGGDNEFENLVNLTAKEHFVAHHLLAKIYGNKLWYAFKMMCTMKQKERDYKVTSRHYSDIKINLKISDETRKKMSKSKLKMSNETKLKISKGHLGKTKSNEIKAKISKANKGKPKSDKHRKSMAKAKIGNTPAYNKVYCYHKLDLNMKLTVTPDAYKIIVI